jgi:hypothetical protein
MATTVSAKIYAHHEKADGTFKVKYVVVRLKETLKLAVNIQ